MGVVETAGMSFIKVILALCAAGGDGQRDWVTIRLDLAGALECTYTHTSSATRQYRTTYTYVQPVMPF